MLYVPLVGLRDAPGLAYAAIEAGACGVCNIVEGNWGRAKDALSQAGHDFSEAPMKSLGYYSCSALLGRRLTDEVAAHLPKVYETWWNMGLFGVSLVLPMVSNFYIQEFIIANDDELYGTIFGLPPIENTCSNEYSWRLAICEDELLPLRAAQKVVGRLLVYGGLYTLARFLTEVGSVWCLEQVKSNISTSKQNKAFKDYHKDENFYLLKQINSSGLNVLNVLRDDIKSEVTILSVLRYYTTSSLKSAAGIYYVSRHSPSMLPYAFGFAVAYKFFADYVTHWLKKATNDSKAALDRLQSTLSKIDASAEAAAALRAGNAEGARNVASLSSADESWHKAQTAESYSQLLFMAAFECILPIVFPPIMEDIFHGRVTREVLNKLIHTVFDICLWVNLLTEQDAKITVAEKGRQRVNELMTLLKECFMTRETFANNNTLTESKRGETLCFSGNFVHAGGKQFLALEKIELKPEEWLKVDAPSGVGKTSLMRVLGKILPFGNGLELHLPAKDKIVYNPQNRLIPLGTLEEIIAYPGTQAFTVAQREKLKGLMQELGLGEFVAQLNDNSKTDWQNILSGGQQTRVNMLRVLMREDIELLILDEAGAGLDQENFNTMYRLLQNHLQGVPVIFSEHLKEGQQLPVTYKTLKLNKAAGAEVATGQLV